MAEIVNLNQYRKKKKRAEKDQTAARNRVAKGRSKKQRAGDEAARKRAQAEIENKKLDKE